MILCSRGHLPYGVFSGPSVTVQNYGNLRQVFIDPSQRRAVTLGIPLGVVSLNTLLITTGVSLLYLLEVIISYLPVYIWSQIYIKREFNMGEFDPLEPCSIYGNQEVTCFNGRIFDFIDVAMAYDEAWEDGVGWAVKLNANFRLLEQLIFGGTCGTDAGGLVAINAAGYTLNNLNADITSSTITIPSGLVATTRNDDWVLFKFIQSEQDLTADVTAALGVGGVDYSFDGYNLAANDDWFYCYLIARQDQCETNPYGLIWSRQATSPNLFGLADDYTFFRKIASARWISSTSSFRDAIITDGKIIYRDQQLVVSYSNSGPPDTYAAMDISEFVPPNTYRASYSVAVSDYTDEGSTQFYINDPNMAGTATGGQIIAQRGPSDAGGAGDYQVNHLEYIVKDQEVAIRKNGRAPDGFQFYVTGYYDPL